MLKRVILTVSVLVLLAVPAFAGQKYNAYTGQWETVPDNYTTQYDAYNNSWSYQPPGAKKVYNAYTGQWDWDSGKN